MAWVHLEGRGYCIRSDRRTYGREKKGRGNPRIMLLNDIKADGTY